MPDNIPDDITREEYRASLNDNGTPDAQHAENDPFTLGQIRKALIAGAGAFASAAAPLIVAITSDGQLTTTEIVGTGIIALGAGISFGLLTWAVPNAQTR